MLAPAENCLLTDQQDATEQLYRRNRYYDPQSGRFTQEDPIGLAGGANLYGFAEGDPVTYSDPFGLCPVCVVVWGAYEIGSGIYDAHAEGSEEAATTKQPD